MHAHTRTHARAHTQEDELRVPSQRPALSAEQHERMDAAYSRMKAEVCACARVRV